MSKKLKPKKEKGRIRILQIFSYKEAHICLRLIDGEIFEYTFFFDGHFYSSYITITPAEGKTKLSEDEIREAMGLIKAGALTSVDQLHLIKEGKVGMDEEGEDKINGKLLN